MHIGWEFISNGVDNNNYMDYELCLELKKAGFPQTENEKIDASILGEDMGYVPIPTLPELIEACGECLSHIKRYPVEDIVYWWAVSHCGHKEHEPNGNNLEEQGKTPEEAVACLWLQLNSPVDNSRDKDK